MDSTDRFVGVFACLRRPACFTDAEDLTQSKIFSGIPRLVEQSRLERGEHRASALRILSNGCRLSIRHQRHVRQDQYSVLREALLVDVLLMDKIERNPRLHQGSIETLQVICGVL